MYDSRRSWCPNDNQTSYLLRECIHLSVTKLERTRDILFILSGKVCDEEKLKTNQNLHSFVSGDKLGFNKRQNKCLVFLSATMS